MRRTVAIAALLALTLPACEFAVKHPAVTAGVMGGVVAAGTCEIGTDFDGEHATCGAITAGTAVALGGIVWLAMLLGGEGNTVLQGGDDTPEPAVPQDPTLDAPRPAPGGPPGATPAPTPAAAPAPTPASATPAP